MLPKTQDKTELLLLLSWASMFTEHEDDVFNIINKIIANAETPCEVDFTAGSLSYMLNNYGKAQELFRNAVQKTKVTNKLSEHITMQIMASAMRLLSLDKEDMTEEYSKLLKENETLKNKKDDTDIKVEAILNMMTKKNPFLGEKCRKIGDTAGFIVKYNEDLTDQERKDIKIAGYLCNTGMLFFPDEIFTKIELLTMAEKNKIKEHPMISASIIKPFGFNNAVVEIIKHHHEKIDGSGYPSKLKEEDIPYGSKIVGLAEFFVEITNDSPRQPAISIKDAMKTIQRLSGLHFSKEACDLLKHAYSL
jgi:HD-GYP domain-containing protein (c-di-GMP phosphodiesterase class II)